MHKPDEDQGGTGSNTQTSHLCPFYAFNSRLWLFIVLLFAFLPLLPSKFHPLEQPSAALLPHRNLRVKITHIQKKKPKPRSFCCFGNACGKRTIRSHPSRHPLARRKLLPQTSHPTARKSTKNFPKEFSFESQVCQAWDTSGSREMV